MAYQPALKEGELHSLNYKSIRDWIQSNKGKIKAKANSSVFYSGRDYDIEFVAGLPMEEQKEIKGTPMWKVVAQMKAKMRDLKLPCQFQTLEDILKLIRDHPKLIDKDRLEQRFSNAYEFFARLPALTRFLPDAKRVSTESWEQLSKHYASNAVGDIKILDGAADDYRELGDYAILLNTELGALLGNKNLSDAGKAVLQAKVSRYQAHFKKRHLDLLKLLREEQKKLKRQP